MENKNFIPVWLEWARKLYAISQNGLTFSKDPHDIEKFKEIKVIADAITARMSNLTEDELKIIFRYEEGYTTPKVDIRGAVFQNNKILLVKEKEDGGWTLPGGFADVGEAPSTAVEREVWEESGYKVKAVKLIALHDRNKRPHTPYLFHIYKLFFLCELIGGEAKTSIETDGIDFFDVNDLPELSKGRTLAEQINMCYKHYLTPELPAEFD